MSVICEPGSDSWSHETVVVVIFFFFFPNMLHKSLLKEHDVLGK